MSPVRQVQLVALLNTVGAAIPLLLTLRAVAVPSVVVPLLGVWGVCWSLPFFVPPGLFVLQLSRSHAALVTTIYD